MAWRRHLLVGGDLVAVSAAVLLAGYETQHASVIPSAARLLVALGFWIAFGRVLHVYQSVLVAQWQWAVLKALVAAGLTLAACDLLPGWLPPLAGAEALGRYAAMLGGYLLGWRLVWARIAALPHFRERLVVLGAGRSTRRIVSQLREPARHDYDFVEVLTCACRRPGKANQLPAAALGPELGGVDGVVVDTSHACHADPAFFERLTARGVQVRSLVDLYEALTGRVLLSSLRVPVSLTNWSEGRYPGVQRVLDCALAGLGLVVLTPVLLVVAGVIVLDSPGAPIYWQERVGLRGRVFKMAKLRTMQQSAEADGRAIWAQDRDPRATRVGDFLRRSHLDELPQLWNVLRGEMSLIGPRPERPSIAIRLADRLPAFDLRHLARPGITGWAQVHFRYAASVGDTATKLEYDLYYLRHRSVLLDGLIALRTIVAVLRFAGR